VFGVLPVSFACSTAFSISVSCLVGCVTWGIFLVSSEFPASSGVVMLVQTELPAHPFSLGRKHALRDKELSD
jgi:small ligand-binding sensory domain FIST